MGAGVELWPEGSKILDLKVEDQDEDSEDYEAENGGRDSENGREDVDSSQGPDGGPRDGDAARRSRRGGGENLCLEERYEIERSAHEIRQGRYRRVALQMPDSMLRHSVRVMTMLKSRLVVEPGSGTDREPVEGRGTDTAPDSAPDTAPDAEPRQNPQQLNQNIEFFVLADTSYGSCCVDEIAAQHGDADCIIHYGPACLSPVHRLPVIYVFTVQPLNVLSAVRAFESIYGDATSAQEASDVILVLDSGYLTASQTLFTELRLRGYTKLWGTDLVHQPDAAIPNRIVSCPPAPGLAPPDLQDCRVFYLGTPPCALILSLSSRVAGLDVCCVDSRGNAERQQPMGFQTSGMMMRRRYGVVTSLTNVPIFGILVNTLSVQGYMGAVRQVRARLAKAGRKSYTFAVGKINPAKMANFCEIGAWVVIGCWQSSIIDDSSFWKPMITPYELELVLTPDDRRIWPGLWTTDFKAAVASLRADSTLGQTGGDAGICSGARADGDGVEGGEAGDVGEGGDVGGDHDPHEEDSAAPAFDLRAGEYLTGVRGQVMQGGRIRTDEKKQRTARGSENKEEGEDPEIEEEGRRAGVDGGEGKDGRDPGKKQIMRTGEHRQIITKTGLGHEGGELAVFGGVDSPAASYLRATKTWTGLGSDFSGPAGGEDENRAGSPESQGMSSLAANGQGPAKLEMGFRGVSRGYSRIS